MTDPRPTGSPGDPGRDLDVALAGLDPAGPAGAALDAAEQERAQVTLSRILATDPADPAAPGARPPRTARRLVVRRVLPVGVVAAVAALVAPSLLGGAAYAGWTPTPEPLSPSRSAAAAATCLERQEVTDQPVRTLVAEQRGEWAYVLVQGRPRLVDGTSVVLRASCLLPVDRIGQPAQAGDRWFGASDQEPRTAEPGARRIRAEVDAVGTTQDGAFRWSEGLVGRDVVGVTFTRPAGGGDVEASVVDGNYAVWWPAGEASGDNPEVADAAVVTLRLRDGSRVVVAPRG